MIRRSPLSLLVLLGACAPSAQPHDSAPSALPATAALPMAVPPDASDPALAAFGREAGAHQIVLLGENGHGVREHTALKVAMVRHLHEQYGFDVIAFESSAWNCAEADRRLDTVSSATTMRSCLLWQLHHAELQPLFEYIRSTRGTARPLRLAGIDMQVHGALARERPGYLRRELRRMAPALADSVATLDSILVARSRAGTDTLRAWLLPHLGATTRLIDSLARQTRGELQTILRGIVAQLERERLRDEAIRAGRPNSAAYYEVRDRYMAEVTARLAGIGPRARQKVVVWLHNDHARAGAMQSGTLRIRATGQFLRRIPGADVYAVGFLMGGGTFADNSRRPQAVATPAPDGLERQFGQGTAPAAWLSLRASPAVAEWAARPWPYTRGDEVQEMRPGDEFDALVYVREVHPPSYELR